ncbi:ssDNA/RNA exonuclease, 3' - 5' specific [Arcobacter venerupis]|uniref:SsDNA/RNA exonuclease, 3'-5' specific n=1 Tax=Arcobacter venerupis TaxID=1054033 RepID=A0AAE7E4H4_9BACT|nr:TatD family hydrolase [Arcobacter venerupis]QKF67404.1 ssDNA/RNA exonuclease, 3' - 5' specific [Arcobacter venerupis]RWS50581.1 hydrolase TatD [Arcobacter venerupis]
MIIDTHCHLDNKQYYEDIDNVIQNALNHNVKGFLIPGADFDDLPQAIALAEKYDEVYFAVGIHPYDIDKFDEATMEKYVSHPKCIAIGECGLDYFRLPEDEIEKEENIKKQKEVFIAQINFAKKVKKPLIVHIREASNDSRQILIDYNAKEVGGVLHCFNASEHLLPLSEHNFYFGIGGVLTFKNAKKLVDILPKIPKERLLIETDAPYLTPHPHRGERNEPYYTVFVSSKMSELLNLSDDEIQKLTTNNAKKLFKEFSSLS